MDAQLRPALIGGTAMLLALGVARFAIPTAAEPEPRDIGCILPSERNLARDIYQECGGGVPFLVHEHRVGTLTTRFEFYPHGEWKRITSDTPGGVKIGCVDSDGVPRLRALLDRATWQREPSRTVCDVAIAGTEAWQVNGVEKLAYNPCDRTQPDRPTTSLLETVYDFEAQTAGLKPGPECSPDALICYESNRNQFSPTAKFIIAKTGAWELTKRDVQSEMITVHATGALSATELADLSARIDRAPWTLVPWTHTCDEYVADEATVMAHGTAITWGTCGNTRPDDQTQAAVDRFFELYRSALGSQPHI